jgi:hypothetical protein
MADKPHHEVTGKLDRKRLCIVISVSGGGRTTSFKTSDEAATLWSDSSPCPHWAREAVRAWAGTPPAEGLFEELTELRGRISQDDIPTAVDRKRKK